MAVGQSDPYGDGGRYFDDTIRGGRGIGSRFLLVIGTEADPNTRNAAAALCSELSDVAELRESTGRGITLVRPDGYVAGAVRAADTPRALESLRSLIERQIRSESPPDR